MPARKRPPGRRRTRSDPVRRVAYDVLWAVDQRDAYANLLLPTLLRERGIEGRDAALATELTYGTLRGLQTYDAILDLCSDRSPGDVDPPVREVLRLGTHQLLATRVASHAAVATSVDLAKDVAGMRPAGFVNAVLRRVSTREQAEWLQIIAPDRAVDPVGYLAATRSYPRWIVEAFHAAIGADPTLRETEEALAAGNARPKITLAALPGLAEPAEIAPGAGEPARWSPFGVILAGGDPAAIPAVAEGRAFVQDEASQLAALALAHAPLADASAPHPGTPEPGAPEPGAPEPAAPQGGAPLAGPGEPGVPEGGAWLDLCAGPGGKSAVLAAIARTSVPRETSASAASRAPEDPMGSEDTAASEDPATSAAPGIPAIPGAPVGIPLLASDVRPHRAELTRAHLRRLPGAAVVAADGRAGAWRPGTFSRVLADVPCSGLGALRRRPEARWRKSPEDIENLGGLQRDLLGAAIDAARPGGVIAYVTCSPHRAETHDVLHDVLSSRDDVTVLDAPAILADAVAAYPPPGSGPPGSGPPGEIPGLRSPAPDGRYAQFWPHRHGTDAIFLALVRRSFSAV